MLESNGYVQRLYNTPRLTKHFAGSLSLYFNIHLPCLAARTYRAERAARIPHG